jgi:hypothetical protein
MEHYASYNTKFLDNNNQIKVKKKNNSKDKIEILLDIIYT